MEQTRKEMYVSPRSETVELRFEGMVALSNNYNGLGDEEEI